MSTARPSPLVHVLAIAAAASAACGESTPAGATDVTTTTDGTGDGTTGDPGTTTATTTGDTTGTGVTTEASGGSESGAMECTDLASHDAGVVLLADDRVFPAELDFGFVRFAPSWGDFAAGPYGTFAIIPAHTMTPAHVHSGSYSAVVIQGVIENPFGTETDPPQLASGSFWHVPGGEQHITACVSDEDCWAYLYADEGFDFTPIDALTDPRSADAVTVTADSVVFDPILPFVSFGTVEGDFEQGPHGSFGLFPGGASAPAHVHSGEYHGVTISGLLENPFADQTDAPKMPPGSSWSVPGNAEHITACDSQEECLFFIHATAGFDVELVCEG